MSPLSLHELSVVTGGTNKWIIAGEAAEAAVGYIPKLEHRILAIRDYTGVAVSSIRKMVDKHGIDHVEESAMKAVRNRITGGR
jgi:hypothetical protein